MNEYVISLNATVIDALTKIDANHKGFLIVLDDIECVVGTITDGDIRRGIIGGCKLTDNVSSICQRKFTFLYDKDDVSDAIEIFKDGKYKFIPIVDENMKFINVITKAQLHSALLQDISTDLKFRFEDLDEGIVDHEIYQRPWGFYKTTVLNDYYQCKVICVRPGQKLSLQSHNHREEYWIVAHGSGIVRLEKSVFTVRCGSTIFIPKGSKHRIENVSDTESLIISEVQIGDYFGEDDIIRFDDIYGRE